MGKIDTWQNEIERLRDNPADLVGLEAPTVGRDLTEGQAERIERAIQKYQDMIDSYEGDDA